MPLTNFYVGESKDFSVTITYNGATPNITADTIRWIVKENRSDLDTSAVINVTADCVTNGANGVAYVNVTPAETDITPGNYYWELVWNLATGKEFVLEQDKIVLYERVEDV